MKTFILIETKDDFFETFPRPILASHDYNQLMKHKEDLEESFELVERLYDDVVGELDILCKTSEEYVRRFEERARELGVDDEGLERLLEYDRCRYFYTYEIKEVDFV